MKIVKNAVKIDKIFIKKNDQKISKIVEHVVKMTKIFIKIDKNVAS